MLQPFAPENSAELRPVVPIPFSEASIPKQTGPARACLAIHPVEDGVAVVKLARHPANAVHREMHIELKQLFHDVDQIGSDVRAIVLGGEGRHFCAGNDLDEATSSSKAPPSA
ncbi:MAG: enoyl-CoA hydratase/isomerase family protein [Rubrivivax sp.]